MERIRDWQSRPDTSPTEGDHVAGGTLVAIRNVLNLDRDIILGGGLFAGPLAGGTDRRGGSSKVRTLLSRWHHPTSDM